MDDTLEARLAAVERALTDDDHDLAALAADGETADRLGAVEDDLDTLRDRVDDLDAATQALRGYVGNVRAVNEEVRERADLALEVAERAEETVGEEPPAAGGGAHGSGPDAGPDQRAATDRAPDEEPTLELATDETPQGRQPTQQPTADQCPLCDGDADTRRESTPARAGHTRDTPAQGRQHGRTDGGLVPDDDAEGDGATVLTKIRALL